MRRLGAFLIGGLLSLGSMHGASACAFHGYTPDPTMVDLLLATEQVVIAQLDPARPDRFRAETVLMGAEVADIPLEVGARTRADLTRDPQARILLVRDGAYGAWLELALLDDTFEGVIRQVVAQQSQWQLGGEEARLAVFARHVNAANPELRNLALRELDRASYASLRQLKVPQVKGLRRDLQRGAPDLMPIRVLLAGLSKDQSFAPLLKEQMRKGIAAEVAYLGAYATALIELQGMDAVEDIVNGPLSSDSGSLLAKEKLFQALAIQQKAAPRSTRRAIERGVADVMRARPELREIAMRQFSTRNHPSLRQPAQVIDGGMDR